MRLTKFTACRLLASFASYKLQASIRWYMQYDWMPCMSSRMPAELLRIRSKRSKQPTFTTTLCNRTGRKVFIIEIAKPVFFPCRILKITLCFYRLWEINFAISKRCHDFLYLLYCETVSSSFDSLK